MPLAKYSILDNSTNSCIAETFETKKSAKRKRDELNGPEPEGFIQGTRRRFSLTPGKDHWRFTK